MVYIMFKGEILGNNYKTNPESYKKQKLKQTQSRRERKLKAIEYKSNRCEDCLQTYHPSVYEFHHIDPTTKEKNLAHFKSASWERFVLELDKCVMLCANCHRLRHWKENEDCSV